MEDIMRIGSRILTLLLFIYMANCGGLKNIVKASGEKEVKILVTYSKVAKPHASRLWPKENASQDGVPPAVRYPIRRDLEIDIPHPEIYDNILKEFGSEIQKHFPKAKIAVEVDDSSLPVGLLGEIDYEKIEDYDLVFTIYNDALGYNVEMRHPSYSCGKQTCYRFDLIETFDYSSHVNYNYAVHVKNDKGKMILLQGKQFIPISKGSTIVRNYAVPLAEMLGDPAYNVKSFYDEIKTRMVQNLQKAFNN